MKKRIATLLAIAIMVVTALTSFVACSQPIDEAEGLEYLNKAIDDTIAADQYYLKMISIVDVNTSDEIRLIKFADVEKTDYMNEDCAQITVISQSQASKTSNSIFFGDSLKKGVKAKKATESDWKRNVKVTPIKDKDGKVTSYTYEQMTFEMFLLSPELKGLNMSTLMPAVKLFVNSSKKPDKITRTGHITTYNYNDIGKDTAKLFGAKVKEDEEYTAFPLTIETVNGKISKVIIEPKSKSNPNLKDGSIKYYVTMQGPNVHVPTWE